RITSRPLNWPTRLTVLGARPTGWPGLSRCAAAAGHTARTDDLRARAHIYLLLQWAFLFGDLISYQDGRKYSMADFRKAGEILSEYSNAWIDQPVAQTARLHRGRTGGWDHGLCRRISSFRSVISRCCCRWIC